MEYYLAIKKNEILLFATPWMDLEGIMLNEISQTEKNRYRMITLVLWNLKPKEQQQQKNPTKQNKNLTSQAHR